MNPNQLLLAHLAASSSDDLVARTMGGTVLGLTGQVGDAGFGATTLESHLVVFTHPEFYQVAGLPAGLDAVEATARQAADYARAVGLLGFVINPGTHQRFLPLSLWRDEVGAPGMPEVPVLAPSPVIAPELLAAVKAAAEGSGVEAVWIAEGPVVATRPHPDPAFEARLLARDFRVRSYGTTLWWDPVFSQAPVARTGVQLAPLAAPLAEALAADLVAHARIHRLTELWAFWAAIEEGASTLALAFSPHPSDAFARDFDVLYARHGLGPEDVPLLDAEGLRAGLAGIGTRLV